VSTPPNSPHERRAFLHIGLPKTGTTYLQHALWSNKDALGEHGILLPGRHRRRHLLASLDVREDPKLARRPGDVAAPWQDLVDECASWPGDVVISHEFFGAASTPQVARAVRTLDDAGLTVHVVLTARSMTDLGLSRWQEWVKSGGKLGVDDYPQKQGYDPVDEWGWGSFDLASVLERWSAVVPPGQIHVLPVDPRSAPTDLWHRFADLLGVDGATFPVPELPQNRSLGVVEVELLRRVNPQLTDFTSAGDRGHWIRGYLGEGGVLPEGRERFRAGEKKHAELAERGARAVAMLESGGFDVRGDLRLLEPSPLTDSPGGLRHPSEVSDTELVEAAAVTIANMLRDVRSLTRERDGALHERDDLARLIEELSGRATSGGLRGARRLRWLRRAATRYRARKLGEHT
jgi:hypothetical protein